MTTPVGAYLRLREALGPPAFLLESVERGEQVGRYSFLGAGAPITASLDEAVEFSRSQPGPRPGEPPFAGGAVGYLSYDWVTKLEPVPLPPVHEDDAGIPEMQFMLASCVVAFDHVRRTMSVIGPADEAERVLAALATPAAARPDEPRDAGERVPETSRERYMEAVAEAKEHIAAGDAFQILMSQRVRRSTDVSPFAIYRALRAVNPSPYMFLLDLGGHQLVGSSPETHVRLDLDGTCELRPIAGTRPRGADREQDDLLAEELMASPKERAEHVMLVDLGRNDLGRVCEFGSVHVESFMGVETYSHVIHIVSSVAGTLREDVGAVDALRSVLPAGTLSGAPKVRAMEIIDELEPVKRGAYGGAVGWLSYAGQLDTCICIRTVVVKDGVAHVQAGGGTVADARPDYEYEESRAKARGVVRAIELAARQADWA